MVYGNPLQVMTAGYAVSTPGFSQSDLENLSEQPDLILWAESWATVVLRSIPTWMFLLLFLWFFWSFSEGYCTKYFKHNPISFSVITEDTAKCWTHRSSLRSSISDFGIFLISYWVRFKIRYSCTDISFGLYFADVTT